MSYLLVLCYAKTKKNKEQINQFLNDHNIFVLASERNDESDKLILSIEDGKIDIDSEEWIMKWNENELINALSELIDEGHIDVLVSHESNIFDCNLYRIYSRKILKKNIEESLFDINNWELI